jgi:hypothetical protein
MLSEGHSAIGIGNRIQIDELHDCLIIDRG